MNKFLSALSAIVVVGLTSMVSAKDLPVDYSSVLSVAGLNTLNDKYDDADYGICLGVYDLKNDNFSADVFEKFITASSLYTGDKVNLNLTAINKDDKPLEVNAKLVFDASAGIYNYTGTWRTLDGVGVDFYSVKSNTQFSIWWMNKGGTTNGHWTTDGLANPGTPLPEISHITAFDDKNTANVPEPSILSLFGLSLLGLGFIRRKKN